MRTLFKYHMPADSNDQRHQGSSDFAFHKQIYQIDGAQDLCKKE